MKGRLDMEKNIIQNGPTPIQSFYGGKCIFVTGATGFLGKLLLERLCALCPEIDTVYVLIRGKHGKLIEERLELLLNDPVFAKLQGDWKSKIVAVEGQIGEPDMKMKQEDRLLLINRTNIVFHSAATVRFDERLDLALKVNVVGTSDVVSLCKEMKNLVSFVHLSTAFANCAHGLQIDEKLYEPKMFFQEAIVMSKLKDGRSLEFLKPKILGEWPNAYTFTKAISEYIVYTEGKDLPVIIFRPALVMGSSGKHSACGYIDSIFGLSGLLVGVGMGVVRILRPIYDLKTYILPGDYCVNAVIAAGWHVAQNKSEIPPVINFVPKHEDNITWGEIINEWTVSGKYMPTSKALWWPNVEISYSNMHYCTKRIFVHLLPALILDTISKIAGKKPMLIMVHRKIEKFFAILQFFMERKWTFQVDGMAKIRSLMSSDDLKLFYCDLSDLDWQSYAPAIIHGVRYYLLKDDPGNVPESRKKFNKLKRVHHTIKFTLIAFAILCFCIWIKTMLQK